MFESEEEYLEKKKAKLEKTGLEIKDKQKMLHDRKINNRVIFILILFYGGIFILAIGMVLGIIMADEGGTTIITDKALDTACQDIYGSGYEFVDVKTGVEHNLNCRLSEIKEVSYYVK